MTAVTTMIPTKTLLKDSGERTTFATGSQRDTQTGKGAFHLVPNWVIWLVSRVYEEGALKYATRNWEKGQPLGQYVKSAENHLAKLKMGMRDEPHASQVIWNMIGYIFTAVQIKLGIRPGSLNDMPDQLSAQPDAIAEPLSPFEYSSIEKFLGRPLDGRTPPNFQGLTIKSGHAREIQAGQAGCLSGDGN